MAKRVRYWWDYFRFSWMIYYAVFLHGIWAIMILFSSDPFGSTPVHALRFGPRWLTSAVLLGAAALAVRGLAKRGTLIGVLLLLPQQALLIVSAIGGLTAAVLGHYADGVMRPHLFIAADQLPGVIAAICHTLAIVDLHRSAGIRRPSGQSIRIHT